MAREPHAGKGAETAAEALERARFHARRALGEALAAMRALLDAASLGVSGRPSEAHRALRAIAALLDDQSERLAAGAGVVPAPLAGAILEALDREIARWEPRADTDGEARAVLRTFLGLREVLWELGLRRTEPAATGASTTERAPGRPKRPKPTARRPEPAAASKPEPQAAASGRRHARVQRVDVRR